MKPARRRIMGLTALAVASAMTLTTTSCSAFQSNSKSAKVSYDQVTEIGSAPEFGPISATTMDTVNVLASTTILGDITKQITDCAGGTTTVLLPEGADPHTFQLSSKQATEIVKADITIINGLDLEDHFEDVLENAAHDGARIFSVADKVNPIPFTNQIEQLQDARYDHDDHNDHDDHDDDDDRHDHDDFDDDRHDDKDPHFWMDPARGAQAAEVIGNQLAKLTNNEKYAECGLKVRQEIAKVDTKVADILRQVPADNRILITDHEAFGYFIDRYEYQILGTLIPGGSTEAEASAANLSQLVHFMTLFDVSVIFTNSSINPKLAQQIAKETGKEVKIVPLHVESLDSANGIDSYAKFLESNAKAIADALK